jgi:MOSC domain-containing protein YiiM
MPSRLLAVSTSRLLEVPYRGETMTTGIYKRAISGRAWVSSVTVGDDEQADRDYHGGPDRAAYAYPVEHYGHFADVLPEGWSPGLFGENFTTEGLDEATTQMGDVFGIGGAVFQVTEPRGPCFKLAHKLEAPAFPKRMLKAGKLGFYLRVLKEGYVEAGDAITQLSREPHGVTVAELIETRWSKPRDLPALERALSVPSLSESLRETLVRMRDAAGGDSQKDREIGR